MDTKALRQKILDLAIRGKLVPQDPNDEPASVLLERIRAEKQQMVKDGKLKAKDIKNDTVIFKGEDSLHYEKFPDGTVKCIENEIPFELPKGWSCERLCNIALFSGGKTPSTSKAEYWGNDYLWITSKDMKSKYIDSSQISLSEKGAEIMQIISPDTLLLVARSGILRHTLPVAILKKQATINQDIKAISLYETSLIEFIYSFLKGMESNILLRYTKSGTTVENINFDAFKNIIIPIPPKAEQIQIIEKINTLLSFIDTIESDKSDLQATIQLTKSKILDLAIRGKLVPQDPNDEPASVLLERIRAEKEELIQQGKIKRDKKESIIFKGEDNSYYEKIGDTVTCIDGELPYELPEGWAWARLQSICEPITDGTHKTPVYWDSGYIFLSSKNVTSGKIDWDNVMYIPEELHKELYSRLQPKKNDILLAKNGTTGVSAIVDRDCVFDIYVSLALIRIVGYMIIPKYLTCMMGSRFVQDYFNSSLKGIGVPNLHLEHIRTALIPIAPLHEQEKIADTVQKYISILEDIEKSLS